MAALVALFLLAAPVGGAVTVSVDGARTTAVRASAQASVRILPGARITLGDQADPAGHKFNDARVTVEDGSQRDAKLVEFQ